MRVMGLRSAGLLAVLATLPFLGGRAFADDVKIPPELSASGDQVAFTLDVTGLQNYNCDRDAKNNLVWTFYSVRAPLTQGGKMVGYIATGPVWHDSDGSSITGKPVASKPAAGPKDYAWQRWETTSTGSAGLFSGITAVVLINTQGGLMGGDCPDDGDAAGEPFSGTYVFLKHG